MKILFDQGTPDTLDPFAAHCHRLSVRPESQRENLPQITSAANFLLKHAPVLACAHFGCHLLLGISIALSKKSENP